MSNVMRIGLIVLLATGVAAADPVAFSIIYTEVDNATGTGFDDPVDGAQRRAAFEAATAVWSSLLEASFAGETITISAEFDATIPSGALGATNQLRFTGPGPDSAGMATTAGFSSTSSNHFLMADNSVTPDISVRFNPGPSVGDWYYGTDGLGGATKLDFMTNVLHEITHGLGFDSAYAATGGSAFPGVQGFQYDTWVQIGLTPVFEDLGTGDTNWFYSKFLTDAERAAAMAGGQLYWFGPNATAANGGSLVKLEATVAVRMGTDVVHTDRLTFPGGLMRPTLPLGFVLHSPDAVTLGMLQDLGWDISGPIPEPGTLGLVALALGGAFVVRRRRRRRAA